MNAKLHAWPKLNSDTSDQLTPARFEPFFQAPPSDRGSEFTSLITNETHQNTADQRDEPVAEDPRFLHEKIATLEEIIRSNEQQLAQQQLMIETFHIVTAAQKNQITHVSKQILLKILSNESDSKMSFTPEVWLHALTFLRARIGADEFSVITNGGNVSNVEIQANNLFHNQKYSIISDDSLPLQEIHVEYKGTTTATSVSDICEQLKKIIEESE
jgi:archaellum component FlaF (FlaF/FlaG flagellin family)